MSRRRAAAGAMATAALLLAAACASGPPVPAWQAGTKTATERAVAAWLAGNGRVDAAELARARREVGATGRPDLAARVELSHCAARVASLVFGPCTGFEALRADAAPAERAYADYLAARLAPADAALLPEAQRGVAADPAAGAPALAAIAEPLSRLVAAGVLFEAGRADPAVIALAVDTASAQGWRRPLLAWLGVQLRLAEQAGAGDDAARLRRRIALAQGPDAAASAAR